MKNLMPIKTLKASILLTLVAPTMSLAQVKLDTKLPANPLGSKKIEMAGPRISSKLQNIKKTSEVQQKNIIEQMQKLEREGGIDSAGGNSVGMQLLDFFEMSHLERFKIENLQDFTAFQDQVKFIEQNKLPAIQQIIDRTLRKRWYFSTEEIKNSYCLNISKYMHKAKIVACQNGREIVVDKNWFDKADTINRLGLLMHELLVGKLFDEKKEYSGNPKKEAEIRSLVRDFFDVDPLDETERNELITLVTSEKYYTLTEYKKAQTKLLELMPQMQNIICKSAEDYIAYMNDRRQLSIYGGMPLTTMVENIVGYSKVADKFAYDLKNIPNFEELILLKSQTTFTHNRSAHAELIEGYLRSMREDFKTIGGSCN